MQADAAVAQHETVWLDANRFYDAESRYYEVLSHENSKRANPGSAKAANISSGFSGSSLASEIAYARQKIQNILKSSETGDSSSIDGVHRLEKTQEIMEQKLLEVTSDLEQVKLTLSKIEKFVFDLSDQFKSLSQQPHEAKYKISNDLGKKIKASSKPIVNDQNEDDDDDIDLFGSDEEDEAATKIREERLQAYANKKAKKPALVAKSSVVLDVKPWDDETDMNAMEKAVRSINTDGLVWGASKFVPLAYGIKKLQIVAVVEDEKVSIDWLQESICEVEDLVQSVDVAAFNKL